MSDIKAYIERLGRIYEYFISDKAGLSFIRHNRKTWKEYSAGHVEGEVLLEASDMASSVISYSYLANILAKRNNARIMAYVHKKKNVRTRMANLRINKIYRSFNADSFIYIDLSSLQSVERERLFKEVHPRLQTKKDVEDLNVEGLWLGDLLYDSYLMNCQVPTIHLSAPSFQNSLKEALAYYVFWRDYLDSHPVKAVIVTHCGYYQYAILLRLAIRSGIPAYQCSATHIYRLSEERLWAYHDFFDYPEEFRALPTVQQQKGLQEAKKRLERRFGGDVGVDMRYSTKSAYVKPRANRVIKESSRIKILVAPHCFFDSPHPYGINLFTDFYEWLNFLGMITKKTDYDWYIKTHPDFLPGNIPIIEEFIKKYPRFNLVPPETSHLQLVSEGINFGLTVYGTIGFEYAALGIPVINASLCNPHIRYRFNIHPKTIDEYEKILMDLPNQKLEININEVYEYYFMAFIYNNTNNWLFRDYEGFAKEIGGYAKQFEPISYEVFIREFSQERHKQIKCSLQKYVDSKEYRFRDKGIML